MERLVAVDYCFGLLSLLLLQGVLNVEGRSLFISGKCCKKKLIYIVAQMLHATTALVLHLCATGNTFS